MALEHEVVVGQAHGQVVRRLVEHIDPEAFEGARGASTQVCRALGRRCVAVGLIGLLLARFTPVFDWLGYIFLPFAWAGGLPDPLLAAKASAVGIAEMFLPATVVAGHESEQLRLVIAVVCVSAIIFFSALVPCILATRIPVKVWQLFVIWAQRVALTLLITTPIAFLMVGN